MVIMKIENKDKGIKKNIKTKSITEKSKKKNPKSSYLDFKDSSSSVVNTEVASKTQAKVETENGTPKIRIKLQAYDHKILDHSCQNIIETAMRNGAKIAGPIPLPTHIKKYTVLRSPFVHKDSREQYEIRTHKRLIDILEPNAQLTTALMNLNLPAGVHIDIKI